MASIPISDSTDSDRRSMIKILVFIALSKFLIHLIVNLSSAYGYFRDEFYYIACSEHLAWGYVDQPPFSVFMLKLSRLLLGDEIWAIRILPALAGAGVIYITGLIVMKLGGELISVILASLAILIAPIFLAMNGFYSMNSYDHLFWIASVYIVVLIIEKPSLTLWLILGVTLGLGLMNKISVLWLGAGIFLGLVFSPHRSLLLSKGPYLAAGVSIIIFLPYIIWQQIYEWPLLEFIENASSQKYAENSVLDFSMEAAMMIHPLNVIIWLPGLFYFLFHKEGKRYRLLGIIFLTVFIILALNRTSKAEYLAPAFPILIAGGAVLLGGFLKKTFVPLKVAIVLLFLLGGSLTAPLVLPILPVEDYISYAKALGQEPSTSEKKEVGLLPQFYADMHGWENMAQEVSAVYQQLSDVEKENSLFFGQNYGQAGAIDFYGNKYPLPKAISSHNNYWIWGPGEVSEELVLIILGSNLEDNSKFFEHVEQKGLIVSKYAMPYESNLPIFVGKRPRGSLKEYWQELKHFD